MSRHNRERRKARLIARLQEIEARHKDGENPVEQLRRDAEQKAKERGAYRAAHPAQYRDGPPSPVTRVRRGKPMPQFGSFIAMLALKRGMEKAHAQSVPAPPSKPPVLLKRGQGATNKRGIG